MNKTSESNIQIIKTWVERNFVRRNITTGNVTETLDYVLVSDLLELLKKLEESDDQNK